MADEKKGIVRAAVGLASLVAAFGLACSEELLDTGDELVVTLEPSSVYIEGALSDPAIEGCIERGGSSVRVLGLRSDGTSAEEVDVQLWLSGTALAALSTNGVTLNSDGINVEACVLPGKLPGEGVVHARSGSVERTANFTVRARAVPATGSLVVSVSPVAPGVSAVASACGEPAGSPCFPGRGRRASVAVQGLGGDVGVVPEGATVTLTTDVGWLVQDECDGVEPYASLSTTLTSGVARAFVCFPDSGGSGSLTVRSGSLASTVPLSVPAFVQTLMLTPNRVDAAEDTEVSFTAFAGDCQGQGVAEVPIALRVTSGAFDFGSAGAVLRTGRDGSVTVLGRALRLPLALTGQVLGVPSVTCSFTVSSEPAEDAGP